MAKRKIPTPLAVAVVVLAVLGLVAVLSYSAMRPAATSDVRPMIAVMNQGKPQTEAVPFEMATQGVAMRGRDKNKVH